LLDLVFNTGKCSDPTQRHPNRRLAMPDTILAADPGRYKGAAGTD
jgi:hypothetical protein